MQKSSWLPLLVLEVKKRWEIDLEGKETFVTVKFNQGIVEDFPDFMKEMFEEMHKRIYRLYETFGVWWLEAK